MLRRMLVLSALQLALAPAPARAAGRKVALLVDDALLERAIGVALEAWNLDVVAIAAQRPADTLTGAAAEARRITDHEHAGALVWISGAGATAALWIFDADTGQMVARPLPSGPPFDAGQAAAAALSVKTLLRSSTVAPPPERVGAAALMGPRERLLLEATVGGRALFGDPQAFDTQFGLALSWWPKRLVQRLGLALGARAGPGVGANRGSFAGRFIDVGVSLAARTRLHAGRRLAFEPALGLTLHYTALDGGVPPLGARAHVDRLDPALDGGVALDVHLGQSVRLGLVVMLAYLFRYQRYLVNGQPVLELFPVELDVALRFTAGVL